MDCAALGNVSEFLKDVKTRNAVFITLMQLRPKAGAKRAALVTSVCERGWTKVSQTSANYTYSYFSISFEFLVSLMGNTTGLLAQRAQQDGTVNQTRDSKNQRQKQNNETHK